MGYIVLYEQDDMVKALRPSANWMAQQIAQGLTEREAVEKVILKDVPADVLAYRGNRRVLSIVTDEMIPDHFRTFRAAWEIAQ